ncbi:glycoside hydrolase family 6 protein [Amycolatopsis regifaucium]|uniref:Glucanase n=1 Tax=Amycolatopsis regifaucium TaxID=546365 RepID=A0A154MRP5_9PSEU|nr:glycoside hydrolase family 6 protein [Amycolatopsis regifaucium]KZB86119.1 cellulose 1,4-beta-cellobiosidase [Amycolatopsis regifaucium]OKA05012.1 cellulose 1,4-beta-cellobiosidase [Amycolatopsis regifaucium]SFH78785.1 Cellulase/cellobiase CelA1 [Amycolatopsis regifaucium]
MRFRRKGVSAPLAVTAVLAMVGVPAVLGSSAEAAPGCKVDYTITNQWDTGFGATVTVTNLGDPISGGWTLEWDFPGNQRVQQGWNGTFGQQGGHVTVRDAGWNGSLGTGATVSPGFNGSYSGTNAKPAVFTLNGTTCTGSTTPTTTTTTPTTTTTTPGPGGPKVDNPYAGAGVYVNPDWSAKAAAEPGGSRIANQPTGVWLDRIAAITGTSTSRGLRAHLDEALRQGAGKPLVVQLVIYNLPGRDCSALASNGELKADELARYQTEYIDPIAAILADSKYSTLRIVNVVEIDSLPNLVTNVTPRPTVTPQCDVMKANGNYVKGVGYALAKLGPIPNVYNYIDAGHHGWLGWDDNLGPSAALMAEAARTSGSTTANVHGFIANTANYGALKEPYFTVNDSVGGTSVRTSKWVDWNRYVDELSYAQAFRQEAVRAGFSADVGMLIDTSRNGWGGTARPTGPGPSTTVDAYVNSSRTDRRIHLGNWCNQSGAGLGERPKAAPEPGIDAYVWIKPPGESDGASKEIPNTEGKGFDRMCDPTYTGNPRNQYNLSGALPDAPLSGHWFSAQFQELMRNAYPAL